MALMQNWSLRSRTLFLGLAPALLMLCVLVAYLVHARLIDLKHEQAIAGELSAQQLAVAAQYALSSGNPESLQRQVEAALRQPGMVRVRVFDSEHDLSWERWSAETPRESVEETFVAAIDQGPGTAPASSRGWVEVGLSNFRNFEREREIFITSLALGLVALVAAGGLAIMMARHLRRPLTGVMQMVERLQERDFSARVEVDSGGELGRLGERLNMLGETLADARDLHRRYTGELVQAHASADRASRAKSDFLAMMSHELRTPLNGIAGMLQLLTTTPLNVEQKDYVHHAEQASEDLSRMVEDILDFSRMEQGQLTFEVREFDVGDLLHRLVENFRWDAQERGLELVLDAPVLPPGRVLVGDPLRVRQILSKLIDNAVKFTPKGRISVRAMVSERPQQQMLFTCEVFDTGIGITPDLLGHIFEPFVQGEGVHSRRFGGAGLGLAIARRMAELMHGSLSVDSEVDVGSCFVFEVLLPWLDRPEEIKPAKAARARVLVVEDNPANQLVAEGMLKSLGCEVEVANNGLEALQRLQASQEHYDVIFMDCQMPEMDGYEATRRWRASEEGGTRVPIIALTAHAMDGVDVSCREAGMDAVVTKPFRRAELARVLDVWLTPLS